MYSIYRQSRFCCWGNTEGISKLIHKHVQEVKGGFTTRAEAKAHMHGIVKDERQEECGDRYFYWVKKTGSY